MEMDTEKRLRAALQSGDLLQSALENLEYWLDSEAMPAWVKASIVELITREEWEELNDRFYQNLAFGTGGMRGRTIGRKSSSEEIDPRDGRTPIRPAVGTNVLNDFTIIKATMGLYQTVSAHLKTQGSISIPRFVIAHDVRYFSRHFAELAASTWSQLGGQAILLRTLDPPLNLAFLYAIIRLNVER